VVRWSKLCSQLLNVLGVSGVKQRDIHTVEPLVSVPNAFELEMATEKLKRHISPGTDKIPGELIKSGVEKFTQRSINLLILFK